MTEPPQLDLDFTTSDEEPSRADQIFAAFKRFHAENPDVWTLFVRFTNEAIAAGKKRFSADAVCHRIRWETNVTVAASEGVKINDHFTAYYGRMFEATFPKHTGFFEVRVRKSAAEPAHENDVQVFRAGPAENESALMGELAELAAAVPPEA